MAEVLHEIIEAEKQAKKMQEDASIKYNSMIAQAVEGAKSLLLQKAEEIRGKKEKEMKAIQKDLDDLHKKILSNNEKLVGALKKSSDKNISKAVDFVLNNLLESIE